MTSPRRNANVGGGSKPNDALAAPRIPQTLPSVTPKIIPLPNGTGACKTFDELKLYWADNYNVKVDDALAKLHFGSVRAALSGVEAVLKEFPLAGLYLKEFSTLQDSSMMSTWRGHGVIYFNPECFADADVLSAVIAAGIAKRLYPKNMTVFGAGAHEAAHIVEDWLIEKYGSANTPFRPIPRRLTYEAYQMARLTPEGKGKSLDELKKEIANYALKNLSECLASAVSDYMTNGVDSATLSVAIWQRLKGELIKMLKPGVLKTVNFSVEERKKYGIFDEWGELVGVKDDAPDYFKEAWEADQKLEAEMWARGID